jgi:alkylation response protein AidB-like acyl-CoA dehydrogenase
LAEPVGRFRRAVADAADAAAADAVDAPSTAGGRALWHRLGRSGVLSEVYLDGGDLDRERLDTLLTELDRRQPLGAVLAVCVQVATAVPLLRAVAGDSTVAVAALAAATSGDAVLALAATDAGVAGSSLMDLRTRVDLDGDTVVLTGGKEWITNAVTADYALVLARHRPARHFTSMSWVLVPADRPGVRRVPAGERHFDGAAIGHLRFDGVRLSRAHLVGRPGRALAEFARHIDGERLAGALWARAMCRRALRDTHRRLTARRAGDRAVWDNDAVRERYARCLVEWCRLDALCAAHVRGDGARTGGPAGGMVLKAAYAESAERILGQCVDLLGAEAFRDGGLAQTRAAAAMFAIAGGATGVMLAGVAERVDDILRAADPDGCAAPHATPEEPCRRRD